MDVSSESGSGESGRERAVKSSSGEASQENGRRMSSGAVGSSPIVNQLTAIQSEKSEGCSEGKGEKGEGERRRRASRLCVKRQKSVRC